MATRTRLPERPAREGDQYREHRKMTQPRGRLDAAAETALIGQLGEARAALVQAAARLPDIQTACLRSWDVPVEDRIQAGAFALTGALEGFDAARGTRLSTYLGLVVERAIRRLGRKTPRSAALASPGRPTVWLAPSASHVDGGAPRAK